MTPVTSVRAKQVFINTQRYITQPLKCGIWRKYPCHKIPSARPHRSHLSNNPSHNLTPTSPEGSAREIYFIHRKSVYGNHTIFSLSEWGTWEDTSSGMTCCISSTSSICCSLQILCINLHGNWIIWIELNSRLAERWWTDWMYGSLYQPNNLINVEIWRASHLQQTRMSRHTRMKTVRVVSLCREKSCEDFTTMRYHR
jgi:hypothetical protein